MFSALNKGGGGLRVIAVISLLGNNTPCSMLSWCCQTLLNAQCFHLFVSIVEIFEGMMPLKAISQKMPSYCIVKI